VQHTSRCAFSLAAGIQRRTGPLARRNEPLLSTAFRASLAGAKIEFFLLQSGRRLPNNLSFRVDFRFVNISGDHENPEYVDVLDSDRYPYGRLSGEDGWFDILDERRLFFPARLIDELRAKAAKLPICDLPPLISESAACIRADLAERSSYDSTNGDY